ncbi:MAG: zinc-ribbon domain-containing protein [Erysipelotrichaceae bacterium]|nr:zinc-ribbon domain-containing protein [Erysipelotrichaceae bacterium]
MFFMMAVLPFSKVLTEVFLQCPADQRLQKAEITETGSRLILFFLPVFTFSKQYEVRFENGSSGRIEGMNRHEILAADREQLQSHLVMNRFAQPSVCPLCGYPLQSGFEFCPKCGRPL